MTNTNYTIEPSPHTPYSTITSSPTLAFSSTLTKWSPANTPISTEYNPRTTHDMCVKVEPQKVNILFASGYIRHKPIAETLQGEVFIAAHVSLLVNGYIRDITVITPDNNANTQYIFDICNMYYNKQVERKYDDIIAIKTTDKSLHSERLCISQNGVKTRCFENIVREAEVMALFAQQNPPQSMIKYYDFFEDDKMYFLVMEKAGFGLLEFTKICHKRIEKGTLSLNKWRKYVRMIFANMVKVTAWMHNEVNCCHLDISLENVVMADDTYFDEKGHLHNLGIRFIDFGLAEIFNKNTENTDEDYICTKYVGKRGYKAPRVYNKVPYYAKKADIWSLGVCLFMLSIGSPLYKRPNMNDSGFKILKYGKVKELLQSWNRLHYVTKTQYDLIIKMLRINTMQRVSIKDVMNHDWMKLFFQTNDMKESSLQKVRSLTTSITLSRVNQHNGDSYCSG